MRFFLKELQCYTYLFWSFRPLVFLGVLASFAALFAQAINNIYTRFKTAGSTGLYIALAEEVSALNRLSSYCFTRFPRSLIGLVL
jgi:hypothetical protein